MPGGLDLSNLKAGSVAVAGLPFDRNYSYLPGTGQGPEAILAAYHCDSTTTSTESVRDLAREARFVLCGVAEVSEYFQVQEIAREVLARGARPIFLGGEHSITFPIVRAVAERHPGLSIVHFDAHPDLYHDNDGNLYDHGCPFARIMEERLASRLVQVGIRTMNPHQRQQAERFGVEVIPMARLCRGLPRLEFQGPVYLSLDIDVLDPAFAPGISHYEPGGMSVREVIEMIQSMSAQLVAADIVELNPSRDINGMTAMAAAKFLKEIADKMLGSAT